MTLMEKSLEECAGCFLLIIILRGAKTSARFMTWSAGERASERRGFESVSHSTDHLGNFVKTDPALLVLLEQQLTCITPVRDEHGNIIILFFVHGSFRRERHAATALRRALQITSLMCFLWLVRRRIITCL